MTMNPLPPQAYTKDTLLKAYQWLTGQSASIKEMASSPDILVSLYLKATRDGDSALERPSIKNFKTELKSLAGMMGELDRGPLATTPMPQSFMSSPQQAMETTTQTVVLSQQTTTPAQSLDSLDARTRDMIREVKEGLNLSSDMEALRLLVKLGHTRSKGLL